MKYLNILLIKKTPSRDFKYFSSVFFLSVFTSYAKPESTNRREEITCYGTYNCIILIKLSSHLLFRQILKSYFFLLPNSLKSKHELNSFSSHSDSELFICASFQARNERDERTKRRGNTF